MLRADGEVERRCGGTRGERYNGQSGRGRNFMTGTRWLLPLLRVRVLFHEWKLVANIHVGVIGG